MESYAMWRQRLGGAVRTARTGVGLTQREMAAALKISPSEVSRIERGSVPLTCIKIHRLAQVMGMQPWQLMALAELRSDEASMAMALLFMDVQREPSRANLARFLVRQSNLETAPPRSGCP